MRWVCWAMAVGCAGEVAEPTEETGTDLQTDTDTQTDPGTTDTDTPDPTLGGAYDAFGDNVVVYLDGDEVVFETNGWPDHPTPYWGPGHELYIKPTATTLERMTPGFIERFQGSYTLRVPLVPELANTPTATGLGPVGIAVSGSTIYNDQEGGNQPLDGAVGGLDYTGAHTGPQSYHYHLEPIAWSDDDDELIGVMADGFFLYGRREPAAAGGGHPTDLDASGGHVGVTPHSDVDTYHYHIQNDLYLNQYYILFPGDYQGTPGRVQ
ncbi:MAG: YHYH protein [Myxococcales bacterium]|nr:YHYH protein [Myxococcales bacterium]